MSATEIFLFWIGIAGWLVAIGFPMTPWSNTTIGYWLVGAGAIAALVGLVVLVNGLRITVTQSGPSQPFSLNNRELLIKLILVAVLLAPALIGFMMSKSGWHISITHPPTHREIRASIFALTERGTNIENQAMSGEDQLAYFQFIVWEQDAVRYLGTIDPIYVQRFNHPRYTANMPPNLTGISAHTFGITRPRVMVLQDISSEHPD